MRKLLNIVPSNRIIEVKGSLDTPINNLSFDSRRIEKGNLYIAIKGTQADGHDFIAQAMERGAVAVVCERFPATISPEIVYVKVADTSATLGEMASAYFDFPSKALRIVGITGTNGKTTTVTLLYRLINMMGGKAGLISTVSNYIGNDPIPATHTTPDAIELNRLFRKMVDSGCTLCFMEVSSHAIVQKRVEGVYFAGGLFSNITHDHLDYHNTFSEYITAKKMFFDKLPPEAFALTNIDDRNGRVMVQNTNARVYTYSLRSMADYRCKVIEQQMNGMLLSIDNTELWCRLIGGFNAYNLLAAYAVANLLGFEKQSTLTALSAMEPVRGRFEHLAADNGVVAVVDYAHTPDALDNVISTITKIRQEGQRLITVVGAGGNRDKTKRPVMAQVAVQGSDMVILTSDNPRNEEPSDIINDMKQGVAASQVGKVLSIVDRREAIRTACLLATPGDIVLIAGKGHETYQEVKGIRHHFDDKEEVIEIFKSLKA
ncbi:MAG TPA: UDP-N-acetylmuramoyl-L-alanyl-D-glutamate--2,6-diaminopimelate ligase [Tenuifilaceae bacterium]|nr:UDP-N-acetylmuramoyl-L-alanyl-D-glutamate--2,6-diaminopimelate ligase [Tenuifilaceae bacterium]